MANHVLIQSYPGHDPEQRASDPYTEARFEAADTGRKAWLDDYCRREMARTKELREEMKRRGGKGVVVTHGRRPTRPALTLCGRPIDKRRHTVGAVPVDPDRLTDGPPTCRTCLSFYRGDVP